MIHSDRPIVTPVANSVFCCFVFLDLKSGDGWTDGRADVRTCAKTIIPTGRDFGLAEWINFQGLREYEEKNQKAKKNMQLLKTKQISSGITSLPLYIFQTLTHNSDFLICQM